MDNKQKSALAIAIAAGVSGMTVADDASAATYSATLSSVLTYSNSGTAGSPLNINSSTGLTWSYDDVTNLMTQTGGTINARSTTAPTTTLFRQFITGLVIGNGGAASAASFSCVEGNFGANVGASICGNYLLGGNFTNESTTTWGPGTSASRTIGGDDIAAGAQQTIALLNGMSTISWVGTTLVLSNRTCTGPCSTLPAGSSNGGYSYTFTTGVAPPADAVNDGPVDVVEGVAKAIFVGTNDVGFGNPVTALVTTNPIKGTATVTSAPGTVASQIVTYTANIGQSGSDSFMYTMDDGVSFNSATVTINIIALAANNDMAATTRGQPVVIAVGANDLVSDDTVQVTIANSGVCDQGGMAAVTAGQGGSAAGIRVTYTPAATAPGSGGYTETCTYSIDDGLKASSADIVIAVSNSVPVANDGSVALLTVGVTPVGQSAGFTAPGAGGNLGNLPAVVTVTTPGSKGAAVVSGNVITYTVTDAGFFTGIDTYTYTVTDLDGETDTGTVTVAISDAAPTISDGAISTFANTVSTAFTPLITSGNGSTAQHPLAVTTNGAHGSCVVSPTNATGTVTYSPNAGYIGNDSCVLTLADGDGDVDTATIQITVRGDADQDGIDDGIDNCLGAANAGQQDADGDGFGNWCDGDFNNDDRVNFADLAEFRARFGSTNAEANLDSTGVVNFADLARFKLLFGKPPGPSGQVP